MDTFLGQHRPECDQGYGDAEYQDVRKLGERSHASLLLLNTTTVRDFVAV